MDVLDPFGAIGEWLGGMCGMRRPAPEESGGSSAAWLRAPLPDDDRTPEPEPETTGAELLRSLLASMLPTVRAAACAALYDMASGGEPIVLGPLLRLFVERKVKRLGVSGAGMGLHLGPVGAVAPDAPLVEAEIVSKLEVEVIAVQIVDGSAPPTQHGIFDGWLPSQAASSQAEAADASSLVVDAELVIHLHLSGDADGQNALDFVLRPLGIYGVCAHALSLTHTHSHTHTLSHTHALFCAEGVCASHTHPPRTLRLYHTRCLRRRGNGAAARRPPRRHATVDQRCVCHTARSRARERAWPERTVLCTARHATRLYAARPLCAQATSRSCASPSLARPRSTSTSRSTCSA